MADDGARARQHAADERISPESVVGERVDPAAGLVLAVLPATLHNVRQGDFVTIASAGGENLFIGNQRGATGGHTALHPQAGDIFSQRRLATELAERERGRALKPSRAVLSSACHCNHSGRARISLPDPVPPGSTQPIPLIWQS